MEETRKSGIDRRVIRRCLLHVDVRHGHDIKRRFQVSGTLELTFLGSFFLIPGAGLIGETLPEVAID